MTKTGGTNMNWTDDMRRLKEAADDIAEKRGKQLDAPTTISTKMEGTYYEKRSKESNQQERVLKEYAFHSPVELKEELSQMWKEMDKEELYAFLPVCMAALAKNKPSGNQKESEQTVSPYIYEF